MFKKGDRVRIVWTISSSDKYLIGKTGTIIAFRDDGTEENIHVKLDWQLPIGANDITHMEIYCAQRELELFNGPPECPSE